MNQENYTFALGSLAVLSVFACMGLYALAETVGSSVQAAVAPWYTCTMTTGTNPVAPWRLEVGTNVQDVTVNGHNLTP